MGEAAGRARVAVGGVKVTRGHKPITHQLHDKIDDYVLLGRRLKN